MTSFEEPPFLLKLKVENEVPFELIEEEEVNQINLEQKDSPYVWICQYFREILRKDHNIAAAVAAVRALTEFIKQSKANTLMELERELKVAADLLKKSSSALSVASGCELFTRFVTRTSLDFPDFLECKKRLIERGEQYIQQTAMSRNRIGQLASSFIRDGVTVLTHGFSRVVISVLQHALQQGKRFNVIVTEAKPGEIGFQTSQILQDANIPVTLILDSAVAFVMDKVDLILVGAEGIVENGGIINKVGTYQISIIAHALSKPFYVASESFKFMRLYPLTQKDITDLKKPKKVFLKHEDSTVKTYMEIPTHDYTPPSYITLLFTDLGILTPSAVSDELIKLYY